MSMTSGYPELHPTDREYFEDPHAPEAQQDPEPIASRLKFREYLDHTRDVEAVESAFLHRMELREIVEDYSGL